MGVQWYSVPASQPHLLAGIQVHQRRTNKFKGGHVFTGNSPFPQPEGRRPSWAKNPVGVYSPLIPSVWNTSSGKNSKNLKLKTLFPTLQENLDGRSMHCSGSSKLYWIQSQGCHQNAQKLSRQWRPPSSRWCFLARLAGDGRWVSFLDPLWKVFFSRENVFLLLLGIFPCRGPFHKLVSPRAVTRFPTSWKPDLTRSASRCSVSSDPMRSVERISRWPLPMMISGMCPTFLDWGAWPWWSCTQKTDKIGACTSQNLTHLGLELPLVDPLPRLRIPLYIPFFFRMVFLSRRVLLFQERRHRSHLLAAVLQDAQSPSWILPLKSALVDLVPDLHLEMWRPNFVDVPGWLFWRWTPRVWASNLFCRCLPRALIVLSWNFWNAKVWNFWTDTRIPHCWFISRLEILVKMLSDSSSMKRRLVLFFVSMRSISVMRARAWSFRTTGHPDRNQHSIFPSLGCFTTHPAQDHVIVHPKSTSPLKGTIGSTGVSDRTVPFMGFW